jgi:hypothetical protein
MGTMIMKDWKHIGWGLLWLISLGNTGSLWAQPDNAVLYQQLLNEHLRKQGSPVAEVAGLVDQRFLALWTLDSLSATRVQVYPPSLQYQRLENKQFQRSLQLTIQETTSEQPTAYSYQHRDTLSADAFREIWKQSPPLLRGEDPRPAARFGKPIALIGTSILLIVSLFYLRSQ